MYGWIVELGFSLEIWLGVCWSGEGLKGMQKSIYRGQYNGIAPYIVHIPEFTFVCQHIRTVHT